jgi:hypothetical protein
MDFSIIGIFLTTKRCLLCTLEDNVSGSDSRRQDPDPQHCSPIKYSIEETVNYLDYFFISRIFFFHCFLKLKWNFLSDFFLISKIHGTSTYYQISV